MKYYYHDRNGELHGPAELDFLACEVKWGGLPDGLTVRPVDGEEWISLTEAVRKETGAGFYRNLMSVPPEEVARLSYWKRLRFITGGPGTWPSPFPAALPGGNACPFSCP